MANTLKYGNAIQIGSLASPPTPAENGAIYYNTVFNRYFKYENGAWTGDVSDTDLLNYYTKTEIDAALALKANQSALNSEIGNRVAADALLIPLAQKGAANGVATLGADQKIPSSQLPAIAITNTFVVASQAAMLALSTAEIGDVAIRTDLSKSFILTADPYSTLANWQELLTPLDAVTSVNGQTGSVILTTTNIAEGSNLYYTDGRAQTAAVVNSTAGTQTVQAPSVASMKTYVNGQGFMKFLSDDTAPALGGDLNVGTRKITTASNTVVVESAQNTVVRSNGTAMIQDVYIKGIALAASQTNTVVTALTVPFATIDAMVIQYRLKDSASNVRIGTIQVVTNGTAITLIDQLTDTAETGIQFSAVISGSNINILYTSGANSATMAADIKQYLV